MSDYDSIKAEHCYDIQFIDQYQKDCSGTIITNLKPSDNQYQMLKDLSYLLGQPVVAYKLKAMDGN